MFKKIFAALLALVAAAAFAAVDVNKATQAELESIKGIGPAISGKILDERKKSSFKDWQDMIDRVKGVGEGNAAKFSEGGLTVGGASFKGAAAAPAAKKEAAPAATKTAAPAAPAAADDKAAKAAAKKASAAEKKAEKAAKAAADAASKPAKK
jgi:competence protein ComEA